MATELLFMHFDDQGMLRVEHDHDRNWHVLYNGTTRHGLQSWDPDRADEPLAYYHHASPIGGAFAAWNESRGERGGGRVAVVGLGAGVLAAYAQPGQHFTFYELDPRVAQIASDPRLFTYLSRCRGTYEVVLGDGLERLGEADDGAFDVIMLDAFVDAAVPAHLVAAEALALYRRKIAGDGMVMMHLNSDGRQVPAVAAAARSSGLRGVVRVDLSSAEQQRQGKPSSCCAVVAPDLDRFPALRNDSRWVALAE